MSGVTQGTRLATIATALMRHADLLCSGSVEADPDGTVRVAVTVPSHPQHAEAGELFQDMLRTVGEEQVRLFAARYGIPAERLEAFLPQAPPVDVEAFRRLRGRTSADATVEARAALDRLVDDIVARRGRGENPAVTLDVAYDCLRVYFGDV